MDIATPLFLIPPGEGSSGDAWEVRAKNGWVSAEGDELRLQGDVKGASAGKVGARDDACTTEQLNVFPDTKRRDRARQGRDHPARLYTERPRPAAESGHQAIRVQVRGPVTVMSAQPARHFIAARPLALRRCWRRRARGRSPPTAASRWTSTPAPPAARSTTGSRRCCRGGVIINQGSLQIESSTATITTRGGEPVRAVLTGGPVKLQAGARRRHTDERHGQHDRLRPDDRGGDLHRQRQHPAAARHAVAASAWSTT